MGFNEVVEQLRTAHRHVPDDHDSTIHPDSRNATVGLDTARQPNSRTSSARAHQKEASRVQEFYPVSSLNGSSPSYPGRYFTMEPERTELAQNSRVKSENKSNLENDFVESNDFECTALAMLDIIEHHGLSFQFFGFL